jgi:hypothetical protein
VPTPTYVPLATVTLGSSAATITFSSIPATYRDLVLIGNFIPTLNPVTDSFYILLNGDTGNSYSYVRMVGTGSAASSYATSGADTVANSIGVMTYQWGNVAVSLQDYSATDKHKTWLSRSSFGWSTAIAGRWANTNAVNSVTIKTQGTTFQVGSTFSIFGVN